jgi:hypothetical protein
MSWLAAIVPILVLIGGLTGYVLPRASRVLGWVVLIGSVPAGIMAFRAGAASGRSCGEMMAGVCDLFAIGMGLAAALAVGLIGVGVLVGAAIARKRRPHNGPATTEVAAAPNAETAP